MPTIGITGTTMGWTPTQHSLVYAILALESASRELHQGGCAGVDEQAADLASRLGYRVITHPSDDVDETLHNRQLVDAVDLLIGVPYGDEEWPGSGTWFTINYAKEVGVPVYVVGPTGRVLHDTR